MEHLSVQRITDLIQEFPVDLVKLDSCISFMDEVWTFFVENRSSADKLWITFVIKVRLIGKGAAINFETGLQTWSQIRETMGYGSNNNTERNDEENIEKEANFNQKQVISNLNNISNQTDEATSDTSDDQNKLEHDLQLTCETQQQITDQTKFGLGIELVYRQRIQIGKTNETSYLHMAQGNTESTFWTTYLHINFCFVKALLLNYKTRKKCFANSFTDYSKSTLLDVKNIFINILA